MQIKGSSDFIQLTIFIIHRDFTAIAQNSIFYRGYSQRESFIWTFIIVNSSFQYKYDVHINGPCKKVQTGSGYL